MKTPVVRSAVISACGLFRYTLTRTWHSALPVLVFLMLNPSTADAMEDDHTIVKCCEFASRNGYGGIIVVNLFAWRATKPYALKRDGWQQGPDNMAQVLKATAGRDVVCAWGANVGNAKRGYAQAVTSRCALHGARLHTLALTREGHPAHPLMLPYSAKITPWAWWEY